MRIFKILLFTPLLLLLFATGVRAQGFGQFASGVFFNINGVPATFNTTGLGSNQVGPGRPDFDGNLGAFDQGSGALKLNGGEMKTFKDNGANVCGAFLNYSIHPFGTPPSSFTEISLPFKAGCSNGTFDDGLGGCSGNDQKWSKNSDNIDLTLLCAGTYVINVFYRIPGSGSNPSSCDQNVFIGSETNPVGTMIFTIQGTLPTPTIQGPTSVCPGATVQLTADNCNGTITWSNGATGPTLDAPAGSYTATCTNAEGCTSPASAPFVVETSNNTPLTATATAYPACEGSIGFLVANASGGAQPYTVFEWQTPDGTPAFDESISTTVPGAYTFTVADACGQTATATATLAFKPIPAAPAVTGANVVCNGATTTLTANDCAGEVGWNTGETGASITATAGSYIAFCTVDGCRSIGSDIFEVTNPSPLTVSAESSATGGVACEGDDVYQFAAPSGGTEPYTFLWEGPNGITSSSSVFTTNTAGTYTVTLTDGCGQIATSTDIIPSFTPKPARPVITGEEVICNGASVTLSAEGCSGEVSWSNFESGSTITSSQGGLFLHFVLQAAVQAFLKVSLLRYLLPPSQPLQALPLFVRVLQHSL